MAGLSGPGVPYDFRTFARKGEEAPAPAGYRWIESGMYKGPDGTYSVQGLRLEEIETPRDPQDAALVAAIHSHFAQSQTVIRL